MNKSNMKKTNYTSPALRVVRLPGASVLLSLSNAKVHGVDTDSKIGLSFEDGGFGDDDVLR